MKLIKSLRTPFLISIATVAIGCGGSAAPVEEPHGNPPAPSGTPSAAPTAAPSGTPAATPAK